MKTKRAFLCSALASFLFVPAIGIPSISGAADSGSDRVLIRIGEKELSPSVLCVAPGTTVLWRNEAGDPVKVKFTTKAVSTTCKEPRGFGGDFDGIQESSRIRGGEVASICFLEPSEYHYRVDYPESVAKAPIEGIINVALE